MSSFLVRLISVVLGNKPFVAFLKNFFCIILPNNKSAVLEVSHILAVNTVRDQDYRKAFEMI